MHADHNHPGLKKYREARARDKARAIMRNEIRAANPNLSDSQVEEIIKASERAKERTTVQVQGRKGKKNKGRKTRKPYKVSVEVVNKISFNN